MRYEVYTLEQWVEGEDDNGRPKEEYKVIDQVNVCVNHKKVYQVIDGQLYTITLPVCIVPKVLNLQFDGKYRLISDEHVYEVDSFRPCRRFTVFNCKEVRP